MRYSDFIIKSSAQKKWLYLILNKIFMTLTILKLIFFIIFIIK